MNPALLRRPRALLVTVVVSVAVAAVLAVVVTREQGAPRTSDVTGGPAPGAESAREFLDAYVDPDGRVVRHDQGGDTVSEGQAYGMLLAVGVEDEETFDRIWGWTQANILRDDGLLSWNWSQGRVIDPESASDADLDAARALVVAADVFDRADHEADGIALGKALLDHETAEVPEGLLLLAGTWVSESPYAFNPSYVSPVATDLLGQASGDPRWAELEAGSRAAVDRLTDEGHLPPDWAAVDDQGNAWPTEGPGGQPVRFGYDAARTLVRHAESCEAPDVVIAAEGRGPLGTERAVASYDLAGSPQTGDSSPLTSVAQASAAAAEDDVTAARSALADAARAQRKAPTYYGDAWAALGPMLLADDRLGGCPPLGDAA